MESTVATTDPVPFSRIVWAVFLALWLFALSASAVWFLASVTLLGNDASTKLDQIGDTIGNDTYVACMQDPDTTAAECEKYKNDE